MRTPWEGPINAEAQFTARVLGAPIKEAIVETDLEGLAAIASGLYAVASAIHALREAIAPGSGA